MTAAFARLARRLGAIRRDQGGATIVEMGFVAPVFGLFLIGLVDLSQAVSQRFTMQQAVDRSLQMVIANPPAGDPDDDGVDYSYVAEEAAATAGVPVQSVTLTRWLQCDDTRMPNFDDTCAADEDTARYLALRMEDDFSGMAYFGDIALVASGAVRIQ